MQRKALALFTLWAAACGGPQILPRPETPVRTQGNTPLPDPAFNDPTPLKEPPTNSFTGTIAELWALPVKTSGMTIVIPQAVVTSNTGNGEDMYVNDPEVIDSSGIEVERCQKEDSACKSSPSARGTTVSIVGTLFTNRDGGAVIGKATVTPNTDVAPITVEARPVFVDNVEKGNLLGNEVVRATLVEVVEQTGVPSRLIVEDLTPADDVNGNFPPELNDVCGPDKIIPEGTSCCPAGIGPKYYSFTLKDVTTGKLISVGTGNYRDIDFVAFACGSRDQAKQLKVGDEFLRFGGIFDVKFGRASISPAAYSDYELIRK